MLQQSVCFCLNGERLAVLPSTVPLAEMFSTSPCVSDTYSYRFPADVTINHLHHITPSPCSHNIPPFTSYKHISIVTLGSEIIQKGL